MKEAVDRFLALVGLTSFADAQLHQRSGGMKQRVAIARMLANDAEIVRRDEAFGDLDAMTWERPQDELLELWRCTEMTVLFVTHSIKKAIFLVDQVVAMEPRPGRMAFQHSIHLTRPRHVSSLEYNIIRRHLAARLHSHHAPMVARGDCVGGHGSRRRPEFVERGNVSVAPHRPAQGEHNPSRVILDAPGDPPVLYPDRGRRAVLRLSEGKSLAVWCVVKIENWLIDHRIPRQVLAAPTGAALLLDLANCGSRECPMNVGFWRLMDAFAEWGIRLTLSINGSVCDACPQFADAQRDPACEVMGHGSVQIRVHRKFRGHCGKMSELWTRRFRPDPG